METICRDQRCVAQLEERVNWGMGEDHKKIREDILKTVK